MPNLSIMGRTGLRQRGGIIQDEWHPNLQGPRGIRIYREMADNDPIIGSMLYVIETVALMVDWYAEPSREDDPKAREQADELDRQLADMSCTWQDTLTEVLTMLPFGFAPFEVLYKIRRGPNQPSGAFRSQYNDGKYALRRLQFMDQESLQRWEFADDGSLEGMVQQVDGHESFIPIEKMVLFRTRTNRGNPEGRSILRNAYRPWYFLKTIQEVEALGIKRDMTGLIIAEVPPALMDPDASSADAAIRSEIEDMVATLERDERDGAVIPAEADLDGPTGYKLRMMGSPGARAIDTDAIVRRYESRILMSANAGFLNLGQENVGTQALGATMSDMFHLSTQSILNTIADTFNRFVVDKVWKMNGIPQELHPRLTHSDIKKPDALGAIQAVTQMDGSGLFPEDQRGRVAGQLLQMLELG